ncbi:hypothetical protein K1719_028948 [Acacia pycnantha]|nr:hypothetical protein K1719_028948 [Acacia pycnantha]
MELVQPNQRIMNLTRSVDCVHLRFLSTTFSRAYSKRELQLPEIFAKNQFRTMTSGNCNLFTRPGASFSPNFSSFFFHNAFPFASPSMTLLLNHRPYSSSLGGNGSRDGSTDFQSNSGAIDTNASIDSIGTSDWADKIKDAWQSAVETVTYSAQKVKEASDELTPHAQQLLDSHPFLKDVIIPFGDTFIATLIIAWIVMPRILRKFHKYAMQRPATIFPGSTSEKQVPYEKSIWGSLEDPVRYLVTFMAFSHIGVLVAPTTVASQYLTQAWRGAVILSFVWFLYRWKTNVWERILSGQNLLRVDRDKLLALDKISSVGLLLIGIIMALAEASGVAVQTIRIVVGIGGVVTAFAARDILGNVFSGLSMQFSKPFTVGDTIKDGSIEGQVVEMGLITTSLLNAENCPVIVPNSLFSGQVIVNKSSAECPECRAIVSKIPLRIEDKSKIPKITDKINSMLRTDPVVFLGKEAPYCYMSRIGSSNAELTIGYNLKYMVPPAFPSL